MTFFRHVINYRFFKTYMSTVLVVGCVNALDKQTSSESDRRQRSSSSSSIESETKMKTSTTAADRLQLYHHEFSFYSQKVVMALHEKNVPFESKSVDLFKGEHLQPWFLALNAKGEVPVLKDDMKIIPDSARIIDYLEDNFSNGDTPRLIPMNQGADVRQNVNKFRHSIGAAPAGLLTTGAMLHQHLLKNTKVPFNIGPIRTALANDAKNSGKQLLEAAEKYPPAQTELLQKALRRDDNYRTMSEESNFLALVDDINLILQEVEEELAKHQGDKKDWWLCSEEFTIADIELTILLERVSQLGLEYMLWSDGKKPCVEQYYERVKKRASYKKTIPGAMFLFKVILKSQAPIVIGVVTAIALIIGGVIITKKFIS